MSNRTKILLGLFPLLIIAILVFFKYSRISQPVSPSFIADKKPVDAALLVTPEFVRRQQESGDGQKFTLIDCRRPEAFKKVRIPGSLNFPLFSLRHKEYLKHRQCVLVNEGYGYAPLFAACVQLRAAGFTSVRVLSGGLNGWLRSGGRLDGDGREIAALRSIPPIRFFQDKVYDRIAILHIASGKATPAAAAEIPEARVIAAGDDDQELHEEIKKGALACAGPDPLYVVILADDPSVAARLQRIKPANLPFTTVFLDGGMQAYGDFLRKIQLAQKSGKLKTPGSRCATCD